VLYLPLQDQLLEVATKNENLHQKVLFLTCI
jgi:hypothetical protein